MHPGTLSRGAHGSGRHPILRLALVSAALALLVCAGLWPDLHPRDYTRQGAVPE